MKRQFEIEYPLGLGLEFMGLDNLVMCLKTTVYIDPDAARAVKITEITKKGSRVVGYPPADAWVELHDLLDSVRDRADLHRAVEDWLHEYVFIGGMLNIGDVLEWPSNMT